MWGSFYSLQSLLFPSLPLPFEPGFLTLLTSLKDCCFVQYTSFKETHWNIKYKHLPNTEVPLSCLSPWKNLALLLRGYHLKYFASVIQEVRHHLALQSVNVFFRNAQGVRCGLASLRTALIWGGFPFLAGPCVIWPCPRHTLVWNSFFVRHWTTPTLIHFL